MNGALDFFITNRQMRLQTDLVAQFTIARHFAATLFTRPLLRGCNKAASHGLQAQIRIDIPAFDVPDIARFAAVGVVAYARFEKTAERAVITFGNENGCPSFILVEIIADLKLVIVFAIRPQGAAHALPFGAIGGLYFSDKHNRQMTLLYPSVKHEYLREYIFKFWRGGSDYLIVQMLVFGK